ncbi:eukaryotic translation initiation factor 4 gamma 3-like isoform X2 [Chironomus tepperi]|uniref:eukaryotic translation initiation factor 4 gamma 3-like isoform X2 n=1 Tax=Chironomus tepperi TaxID=113505 RepID=UPI00391F1E1C
MVSRNFYHRNQMNGNLYGQRAPGYYPTRFPVILVPQSYPPVHPVVLPGVPPQYTHQYAPQTFLNTAVPPPSSNSQPVVLKSIHTHIQNAFRKSRAIPIVDPKTKKVMFDENQRNKDCSLNETAAEFVPSTNCTSDDTQNKDTTETEALALSAQDTVVDLNDTLDSDALDAGLSFENKEENPSLTAIIKQIPSNLEQKLNQDDEIQLVNNLKPITLPKKQESHSSLPDAFPDESSRKRNHETYSHSPPSSRIFNDFQQFHPRNFDLRKNTVDNRQFQNNLNRFPHPFNNRNSQQQHQRRQNNDYFAHNNERNYHRTASERNLSTFNSNSSSYHHNRTFPVNNTENTKVDQECTAHPIKDSNQNYIVTESEKSKEVKYDENNNEITEESVNLTESSLFESTTENSESSLNLSCRYSTKKLTELKKSPLVLSKPPTIKDGLLDSSMNKAVWSVLFDKKNRIEEHSNEDNNMFMQNNKSNYLKRTNSNMRYDNNQNQLCRSKSGNEKQLIKMNLSIKEDVKLNSAENAWKPSHMKHPEDLDDKDREMAELLKNFRSLLNKITEENFEHLVKEINDKRKYMINSSEKLSAIVKLLFEKSISEPGYASTYAKLCQALSTVHLINDEVIAVAKKTTNPWKIYLISHCQQEFERSKKDDVIFKSLQESINKAKDTEEIENYEDLYFKIRQRANGTVKFIGELYKMNMLTAKIMMGCIEVLLTSITEENIERLCKLLTTVGEKLEGELKNKNDMDKYMNQLSKLRNSNVITTQRIKFDILNVIDLRASRWRQRENARILETKPQKLQDLQEEENKKKRLMQQQLNDYQPKQSSQNNLGRQRSQRSFDNDGFRVNVSKHFDFNKLNIPKTNNAEMSLGPPRNLFQNFHKPSGHIEPPPTRVSNPYANLLTDCDDVEQLPTLHHTRSGSSSKNNRKDKKNGSHSQGNNNNKEKSKTRSPSPVVEKPAENDDDDFFMIDLTENEEKDMRFLTDKMQQFFKAKITIDMLLADLKKIKITKNILGQVFTDLFDKKSNERKELIELLGDICRKGNSITKAVNIEALKLAIKSIPTIICDVPLAYDYFCEYCVYFYENGLITSIKDIECICQNQQSTLDKIKKKLNNKECKQTQNVKNLEEEVSDDLNKSDQSVPSKVKNERCLQKTMKFIQFKLEKKQKNSSFLEEIYNEIDKEKCSEVSNFIQDLTITILKAWLESKGKKSQKKMVDMTKLYPLFIRYLDNDILAQVECINALNMFAFTNPNIENCNLCTLFDLFYENDVISMEAFNIWRKQNLNSPSKREALNQTVSFFVRLDEADISDDFNCTSSTIKED